jgi:hypothetical protein
MTSLGARFEHLLSAGVDSASVDRAELRRMKFFMPISS